MGRKKERDVTDKMWWNNLCDSTTANIEAHQKKVRGMEIRKQCSLPSIAPDEILIYSVVNL